MNNSEEMNGIEVDLGERSYPIYVETGILDTAGTLAKTHKLGHKIAIITDENVAPHYQERVVSSLEKEGFRVSCFILPPGEHTKSLRMCDYLYEKIIEANFDRKSVIMSLGGGVVGDLAGFIAASFMRGVPFVQIPTTLLAQTDSSVGGKVGINHRLGKNLIGAFYQPEFVLIDPEVLKTLPQRELWAGMAEVVKYGLIYDREFVEFLDKKLASLIALENMNEIEMVIEHCCSIKADVVANDEKEKGLRRILNFGHTVGHALEAITNYDALRHGEAVTLGMRAMLWLSWKLNMVNEKDFQWIDSILQRMQLPEDLPEFSPKEALELAYHDKKVADGVLHLVLLDGIGAAAVRNDVDDATFLTALEYLKKQILVRKISTQKMRTSMKVSI